MSGGGGKASLAPFVNNTYNTELFNKANQIYSMGEPLRQGSLADLISFLYPGDIDYLSGINYGIPRSLYTEGTSDAVGGMIGEKYDPYKLAGYEPVYKLAKSGLENQYSQAKENILANTPRGGALTDAMTELERSRAYDVGALPAQIAAPIIQDLYNKAYEIGWQTTPSAGLGGMSNAASTLGSQINAWTNAYANTAAANAARGGSSKGGLGTLGLGVGSLLGNVFGGPLGGQIGGGLGGLLGGVGNSGGWASIPSWGMTGW